MSGATLLFLPTCLQGVHTDDYASYTGESPLYLFSCSATTFPVFLHCTGHIFYVFQSYKSVLFLCIKILFYLIHIVTSCWHTNHAKSSPVSHVIKDTFSDLNAPSVIKSNLSGLELGDTVRCIPLSWWLCYDLTIQRMGTSSIMWQTSHSDINMKPIRGMVLKSPHMDWNM
jgi:hypothetical protein